MPLTLADIASAFEGVGPVVSIEPYGSGHINRTYLVTCAGGDAPKRHILQEINSAVFPDVPALMDNIVRVTRHLQAKYARPGADPEFAALSLIPTREGAPFLEDSEGRFWRMHPFISGARTIDVVETPAQAREAARAYARFLCDLADLPEPPLHETLPDFHNGPLRFRRFEEALSKDICGRALSARDEIAFLYEQAPMLPLLTDAAASGALPRRTTHNDTKINNVMLDDKTGCGVCVIDLDTVMPGLSVHDFGDLVRSSVCPAAEDERDLARVTLDANLFRALGEGYLEVAGDVLTEGERRRLVLGAQTITLIIGMRFLTDHLAGDVYFRVHRDGHNLDRCRTQFRLVRHMLTRNAELEDIVASVR